MQEIFQYTENLKATIVARYIPGRYNAVSDSLSRMTQLPEWSLSPQILSIIFSKWGIPQVDLFASKRSAVVPVYVAEDVRDRSALYVDAFSRIWEWKLAWIFPPPCLLPIVLRHLNNAKGIYMVVCPRWEKVHWRGDLKARAIAPPFVVPDLEQNLIDLTTWLPPPRTEELQLEIWKVRGGPVK